MPSISVPDRTRANMAVLADTASNGSPSFPFHVCHRNGYFALDPAVEYDPTTVKAEVTVTMPRTVSSVVENPDSYLLMGAISASKLLITPFSLFHYTSSYSDSPTIVALSPLPVYEAGHTYIFRLYAPDKDTLVMTAHEDDGTFLGEATASSADLFSGNPTITFGYPTKAQLAANNDPSNAALTFSAFEGLMINGVGAEHARPTDITLSQITVSAATAHAGSLIGTLTTTHATELRGFEYTFAAGTGDTDNASFSIVGDKLLSAGTLTVGTKSIRVRSADRFDYTYVKALSVVVSA